MTAHLTSLSSWLTIICLAGAIYCAVVLCGMVLDHLAVEHESRDARDTSPHVGGDLTDADMAEYAAAADEFTPTDRAYIEAMRAIDRADVFAEDGCWHTDHDRGVHSAWHGRLPERGA